MAEIRFHCFSCGTQIVSSFTPGRRDDCPKCGADVHVCKNCVHYDPHAYNECRETAAEVVREKDRANYCDFFQPGGGKSAAELAAEKARNLRAAAEALFKKKP